jgi:hypothetical protein
LLFGRQPIARRKAVLDDKLLDLFGGLVAQFGAPEGLHQKIVLWLLDLDPTK